MARTCYIGPAFLTGGEAPTIGSVISNTWIGETNSILIWARDVFDAAGISNVFCVITPPDYVDGTELPRTNLTWNSSNLWYEALLTDLTNRGSYTLTFLAENTAGLRSAPMQSFLVGRDIYEPDDTREEATFFAFDQEQVHNFHASNDEDWVYFYAVTDCIYQIEAEQIESNVDLRLDVYYASNGALQRLDFLDEDNALDRYGKGVGEVEQTTLDFITFTNLSSGCYYVRVSSADTNGTGWGPDSGYVLQIFVPGGGFSYQVVVRDGWSEGSPHGTHIFIDGMDYETGWWETHTLTATSFNVRVEVANCNYRFIPVSGRPHCQSEQSSVLTPSDGAAWFLYKPYVPVSGSIRDAYVGAFVDGAALRFTAQTVHSNDIYFSYPNPTGIPIWATTAAGDFPSNVLLPPAEWELTMVKDGYLPRSATFSFDVSQSSCDLGPLFMRPRDSDTDKIADTWETNYFGTCTNCVVGEDRDGDGACNWAEYVAGTDPTNSKSVLMLVPPVPKPGGTIFNWPVVAGRAYRIQSKTNLLSENWFNASGIQTARVNEVSLQWTDTDTVRRPQMFYRLQLIPPAP